MGTRGLFGFRLDNKDKVAYNQFDSYPSNGGKAVVKFCRKIARRQTGFASIVEAVRNLRLVSEDDKPTAADQKRLIELGMFDSGVSTGQSNEWYCLLRNAQGDLDSQLKAGVVLDGLDFVNDSLFCEWGWIVNLDLMRLEIYRGFQRRKHRQSRYARRKANQGHDWKPEYEGENQYFPCALIKSFPLDAIPRNWSKQLDSILEGRHVRECHVKGKVTTALGNDFGEIPATLDTSEGILILKEHKGRRRLLQFLPDADGIAKHNLKARIPICGKCQKFIKLAKHPDECSSFGCTRRHM